MTALAEIVRKVFKKKRKSTDILPRIEGETSSDWMALDLGMWWAKCMIAKSLHIKCTLAVT